MNSLTVATLCIHLIIHLFIFNHHLTAVDTAPANPTTENGMFTTSNASTASDVTESTTEDVTATNTNSDTTYTSEGDTHSSSTNPHTYTTAFQSSSVPAPKDICSNSSDIVHECNVNTAVMGVPVIDKIYVDAFTPACTRHDICYKCGARFHKSRENCDVHFLDTMTNICQSLEGIYDHAACGGIAGIFYAHVYLSGQIQYNEQPSIDCSNIWVAICLG